MMKLKHMKKMVTLLAVSLALGCCFSAAVVAAEDRIPTTLNFLGPTVVWKASTVTFLASLHVPDGTTMDLSGRTITFTLGCETGGDGNGTCDPHISTAITDATGVARTTYVIYQPNGVQPMVISFAGDDTLAPSQFSGYVGVLKR